ncbi:MAG: hypothetical protein SFV15_16840 [Polyangiaceae bacterium]|nr:hypothetical protein [Polyangiaceae bacterium]
MPDTTPSPNPTISAPRFRQDGPGLRFTRRTALGTLLLSAVAPEASGVQPQVFSAQPTNGARWRVTVRDNSGEVLDVTTGQTLDWELTNTHARTGGVA